MKTKLIILFSILTLSLFFSCEEEPYTILYHGNNADSGAVPIDSNEYEADTKITVLDNTGNLIKTQDSISLLFCGWTTDQASDTVEYFAGDTITLKEKETNLYAVWSILRGAGPAGGYVFYDKGVYSDGWRYLEASPSSTEIKNKTWYPEVGTVGATLTQIGYGENNTTTLVNYITTNSSVTDSGVQQCYNLSVTNDGVVYDDWFMPTKDEFNEMYSVLNSDTHDNFNNTVGDLSGSYWTSTEVNESTAYYYDADGYTTLSDYTRTHYGNVRAIRKF